MWDCKLYYSWCRLLYDVVLVTKIKRGVWRGECISCTELVVLAVLLNKPCISLCIFYFMSDTSIELFFCLLTYPTPIYQTLVSISNLISLPSPGPNFPVPCLTIFHYCKEFFFYSLYFRCIFHRPRKASITLLSICFWHRLFVCYFIMEKELFCGVLSNIYIHIIHVCVM